MAADTEVIKRAILAEVIEEALLEAEDEQLGGAAELASALQALSLAGGRPLAAAEEGRQQAECSGEGGSGGEAQQQEQQDQGEWLTGSQGGLLGVQREELEAKQPSSQRVQEAVRSLMPRIERRLAERCQQLAAAVNYGGSSYDGLPDHLAQLVTAADRRPAAQSWRKAAAAAQQAVGVLGEVNQLLVAILAQHKLGTQKEADEAKAAFLAAQCSMLLEKLRVVEAQLLAATYTPTTLPALRRAQQQLEGAVAEAAGKLRQASAQLAQYRALGPSFEALAREHAAVQQQIAETQFQLAEVEQFAQLQRVIG